jgi:glyoxylase-like metal-dependent hydrolase (beta-lactamase superfamily II)
MNTKAFFDPDTSSLTYVVWDPATRDAVVIDPVLDFERTTWRILTHSVDAVSEFAREHSLRVRWVLDTHAHADHLSGMAVLKDRFGAPTAIGAHITEVQAVFAGAYNLKAMPLDGRQWDRLLADGQVLEAGSLKVEAIHTPGHTPACISYRIGDAVFAGDTLFMPDYGTGRCDFPKGSAEAMYESVQRLYKLPDATKVFVGHDYQPGGREVQWETTIGASKASNIQLSASTSRAAYVAFRQERDKGLAPPGLILQSLQVNIAAGELPEAEDNGRRYLRMPLGLLGA